MNVFYKLKITLTIISTKVYNSEKLKTDFKRKAFSL